ncbi:MAG: hypothetical protein M3Y85_12305 [Bacteroidota bacterium]|nr:hypothetical protein [Bacteroidota bacterium]
MTAIIWNEYYLDKLFHHNGNEEPNWLGALLSYPAFKWGLFVGVITLALFMVLGMRRQQRMIPHREPLKNDSLDFVKTLGRLYYDKKDHKNLADKMAAYFLEHVRSKYALATHTLDDAFAKTLHFKTGYTEEEIKKIIITIDTIKTKQKVIESELASFYQQLEMFYQNT